MTIEVAILISIVSCISSVYSVIMTTRRNFRRETRDDAEKLTSISIELKNLTNNMMDIKEEIRGFREDVGTLRERVAVIENDNKAIHERLNAFRDTGMVD